MADIKLEGKDLIRDIDSYKPGKKEIGLWWLGQHSFVVKAGTSVVYIDPYLEPAKRRQVPPLLKPMQITNAAIVLGTHDHGDHIDRTAWPGIAVASPKVKFVVPDLLLPRLGRELGIASEHFVGMDEGKTVDIGGVKVSGVAAAHEFLDRDEATGKYPYLGYVIETGGFTLYHAGDTCKYEGLETKLKKWKFDVMFLPINGRDAERLSHNCIGNMTYQEAADLAGALKPKLTIPAHYDMFAMNSEDPKKFTDYMKVKYPNLKTMICGYGARVSLGKG